MATPYLSQISLMSFGFPPRGWAQCNGQQLPINQNQALFALLGTQYGGNGVTTFNLPDLRGRVPMHRGSATIQGQALGAESVSLNANQLPAHTHALRADTALANSNLPGSNLPAAKGRTGVAMYATPGSAVAMHPGSVAPSGGNQAHDNMQPYTAMNFVIALQGIFPSHN